MVTRRIVEESIAKGKKAKKDMSVLEKFIDKNGVDSPIPSIMASDMLFAGIETTGNTLGFLLYNLATNPSKQEKVREEMMQFGETLSPSDVDKLKYLSACMKESQRVTPTVNGWSRGATSVHLTSRNQDTSKKLGFLKIGSNCPKCA